MYNLPKKCTKLRCTACGTFKNRTDVVGARLRSWPGGSAGPWSAEQPRHGRTLPPESQRRLRQPGQRAPSPCVAASPQGQEQGSREREPPDPNTASSRHPSHHDPLQQAPFLQARGRGQEQDCFPVRPSGRRRPSLLARRGGRHERWLDLKDGTILWELMNKPQPDSGKVNESSLNWPHLESTAMWLKLSSLQHEATWHISSRWPSRERKRHPGSDAARSPRRPDQNKRIPHNHRRCS